MNCSESNCLGKIEKERIIPLVIGCGGIRVASYPCGACGRLYWNSGIPVLSKGKKRVFLEKNKVVMKEAIDKGGDDDAEELSV